MQLVRLKDDFQLSANQSPTSSEVLLRFGAHLCAKCVPEAHVGIKALGYPLPQSVGRPQARCQFAGVTLSMLTVGIRSLTLPTATVKDGQFRLVQSAGMGPGTGDPGPVV